MAELLTAPFLTELTRMTDLMYAQGWDERNGGNISLRLDEAQLSPYLDPGRVLRRLPLGFAVPDLAGDCFLVTGAGKYFKNISRFPERDLGLLRIAADGSHAELLWGLSEGGTPTSELSAHLLSHMARRRVDPDCRVVTHCHPDHLLAMSFVHDLDPRAFTRSLWRMCSECIMVFPDGVNVLPWMLCGTREIGEATAQEMTTARLVLWAQHGIYAAGRDLEETFGLIETAEKAARIWLLIAGLPQKQTITDQQLRQIAAHLHLQPRPGYLD